MGDALEKQVSGNHYKQYKMEPIELIVACKWDFIQGNIAKYLLRAKYKNGIEDIEKAKHYCQLGAHLTYPLSKEEIRDNKCIMSHFIEINELPFEWMGIFMLINAADYENLHSYISQKHIIEKYFL